MTEQTTFTSSYGNPGTVERQQFIRAYAQQYKPCENGLHFCGIDDDAGLRFGPHFTILNLPLNRSEAEQVFARARADFEVPQAEGDVLVDLQIDGSCEDNFFIRRQMVEIIARSAAR